MLLSGWLSPTGEFHSCPYWGHIDLAYELLGAGYEHECAAPDEELIQKGWIKLYTSMFADGQQIYYNYDKCRATENQRIFLKQTYDNSPSIWDKVGIIELKTLGVLDEEYDENGFLI